jgi:SNF2 family DNA or RNA helicase
MGLGKTVQAIAFLAYLEQQEHIPGPHLIVVPASTYQNWQNEIRLWSPSLSANLVAYRGSQQEKEHMRGLCRGDVSIVLTTYNMFERDSGKDDRSWLRKFHFQTLICDEAHGLKNEKSKRHQNLEQMNTNHRLMLTGTPMQNDIRELLAVLKFCMPHVFSDGSRGMGGRREKKRKNKTSFDDDNSSNAKPRFQAFAEYFEDMASKRGKGAEQSKKNAVKQIQTIMKPFVLRRLKMDGTWRLYVYVCLWIAVEHLCGVRLGLNVRMCECANVRMCECSNVLISDTPPLFSFPLFS